MKLDIRTQGIELTERLRSHVERHLRYALTRFGPRMRRVSVQLRDVNGPRGGRDIECKVLVELTTRETLVLTDTHDTAYAAVANASGRVAFAISRRLGRAQARWRNRRAVEPIPAEA